MCLFEPRVPFDHHDVLCKLRGCGPCESYQPFPFSTLWVVCRAPYDLWNINRVYPCLHIFTHACLPMFTRFYLCLL